MTSVEPQKKYFLFTCDVESAGSHSEQGVYQILRLLDRYHAKGTFFVTYYILDNHPQLVREIFKNGHEIASHGYSHPIPPITKGSLKFLDSLSSREIEREISRSYHMFIDNGFKAEGFRAPAFRTNPYIMQCIQKWFRYDSSCKDIPSVTENGGHHLLWHRKKNLMQIPVSTLGSLRIPFGSPYFSLLGTTTKHIVKSFLKTTMHAVFYCHSYDLISLDRRLLSGISLAKRQIYYHRCGSKRTRHFFYALLSTVVDMNFEFITCSQYCDIADMETNSKPVG